MDSFVGLIATMLDKGICVSLKFEPIQNYKKIEDSKEVLSSQTPSIEKTFPSKQEIKDLEAKNFDAILYPESIDG